MQFQTLWTAVYLVTVSILGFNLLTEELNAQTKTSTQNSRVISQNIPIDDQARYLRGLESRSASQWNFTGENPAALYQMNGLQLSDSDIKIIEQKPPEWRNSGDDPNYSVLVDVYEFTDETDNSNNLDL